MRSATSLTIPSRFIGLIAMRRSTISEPSIRNGQPTAQAALGMEHFAYYGQHPEEAALFDAGMAEVSAWAADEVLRVYDFSGARVVADVGGGHGSLLVAGNFFGAVPEGADLHLLKHVVHVTNSPL
jgi:O-methyltransferase